MIKCLQVCKQLDIACPIKECRYWIAYSKENNCTHETIYVNGQLTLREVAERLGISYVRVKQIQDKALKKIGHLLKDQAI